MDELVEQERIAAVQPAAGGRSLPPLLKRFLHGALWSVVAALAARGLPVIGSLIVAGLLGREGYGQLGVVQNTLTLFTVLSGLGLGLSATRFVAANRTINPTLASIYASLAMRITVGAGGVLALVTFFAAPILARAAFDDPSLTLPLQLAAPIVIFAAINSAQMGILTGLEAYRSLALAGIAQGVLTSALLIAGGGTWGVTGAIVALAIAEALSAGVLWLAVRSARRIAGLPSGVQAERVHWSTLLRFSIPALLSSSLTLPASLIGTILLTQQAGGISEMGLYSAASRWSFAVLFIPTAVSRIVLPMLANLDGSGDRFAFRRIFFANVATSSVAVAVPSLALILLAGPVMGLLGADYRMGSTVLIVLLLAALPITLNEVIGQVMVSTGSIYWRLTFDVILAGLLIGLAFVLIPRWDAVGLAASQLIAYSGVCAGLGLVVANRLRGGAGLRLPASWQRPGWVGQVSLTARPTVPFDRALVGLLIVAWLALIWFVRAMPDPNYVVTLVPAIGMPLVLALLPACRPKLATPLCPHNWVLFIFVLQGLILPLMINGQTPELGNLPYLPTTDGIDRAILISFVAFVAYCVGFQWANRGTGTDRVYPDVPLPERRPPHIPLGLAYGAIGALGFLLAFGSIGGLITYYIAPPEGALVPSTAPATLSEAASTFLRPFAGFAVVLFWGLWADRRAATASRRQRLLVTAAAALAIVVVYASFGYNRGAFTAPLIALIAAYSMRVRRIPWKPLLIGGLIGLTVLIGWGLYRTSEYGSIGDILANPATLTEDVSIEETLQVYGGSPQLTGFVLDQEPVIPDQLLGGRSLIGSLLSPLPIIGEPFREASGFLLFNELIYGPYPEFYDQVMPFQSELYVNFGIPAIIVAYIILALLVSRLERGFQTATSTIQTFTTQYGAIWLAFLIPGSLAATSQIFIYFFWPVYVYLGLRFIGWRSERNTPSYGNPSVQTLEGRPA